MQPNLGLEPAAPGRPPTEGGHDRDARSPERPHSVQNTTLDTVQDPAGGDALERIERELTLLLRRAMKLRVEIPGSGGQTLDRSAYAILARLHHAGACRLTALATAFELDISTVSRQVQNLSAAGLIERATDPADRRAALLTLTAAGKEVVTSHQRRRRERLQSVIDTWPEADRAAFAQLLEQFNAGMAAARAAAAVAARASETAGQQHPAAAPATTAHTTGTTATEGGQ